MSVIDVSAPPISDKNQLPDGFAELEPFVDYWSVKTTNERWQRRSAASIGEIERFYDAVLSRADDIVKHLEAFPLSSMPEPSEHLMCLLLALANCAIAVELHKAPRAPYSPFPHGIRILKGAQPLG